jgi:hypothetical protein
MTPEEIAALQAKAAAQEAELVALKAKEVTSAIDRAITRGAIEPKNESLKAKYAKIGDVELIDALPGKDTEALKARVTKPVVEIGKLGAEGRVDLSRARDGALGRLAVDDEPVRREQHGALARATEREPARRIPSVEQFAAELAEIVGRVSDGPTARAAAPARAASWSQRPPAAFTRPTANAPDRAVSRPARRRPSRWAWLGVGALVALLVCLIPTTIGGLLSAIGIAGMDRLVQHNVLATSGRAVEAAERDAEAATAHHMAGDSHDAPLAKGPHVTMRAARHSVRPGAGSVSALSMRRA